MDFLCLKQNHLDALKEIFNIGAGNAATALSQLIDEEIDMSVPGIEVLPFSELHRTVGGSGTVVAGIYLQVYGDIPGEILFTLSLSGARQLAALMLKREDSGSELDELESSAIKEAGNILTGHFLNALSEMTSLSCKYSVPYFCADIFDAILDSILYNIGADSDYALSITTNFKYKNSNLIGNYFYLPQANSLDAVLRSVGVKL